MEQNAVVAILMQEQKGLPNIFLYCHLLESARGLKDENEADVSS